MRETKMSTFSLEEAGSSQMKEMQYPYPKPFSKRYFSKNNK